MGNDKLKIRGMAISHISYKKRERYTQERKIMRDLEMDIFKI
jgi:hypothetical protein